MRHQMTTSLDKPSNPPLPGLKNYPERESNYNFIILFDITPGSRKHAVMKEKQTSYQMRTWPPVFSDRLSLQHSGRCIYQNFLSNKYLQENIKWQ